MVRMLGLLNANPQLLCQILGAPTIIGSQDAFLVAAAPFPSTAIGRRLPGRRKVSTRRETMALCQIDRAVP